MKNLQQFIPKDAKAEFSENAVFFEVPLSKIKEVAQDLHSQNLSLKLITATDERKEHGCFKIWYIFASPKESAFIIPFIQLKNTEEFPSLSSVFHESGNYERKIRTFFGLIPIGHPDSRPIILHENWPANVYPLRKDVPWNTRPKESHGIEPLRNKDSQRNEKKSSLPSDKASEHGEMPRVYQFQEVGGEGIYEIPVGPIHAGIIEPGHFRFSVAGEEILLLEARLGFTHKGSEKLFETLPPNDMVRLSEKISGDSSFSHSLAFCQALEALSETTPPKRAKYLRVIYAELERLANHFGDIGAIMIDAGFNFGGANGARLREMVMRINEKLTGSRFLRGINVCGGVTKDIGIEEKEMLSKDLAYLLKDFSEVMNIAENSASLLNRLKGTGVLSHEIATDHGATGIAAKAVGIKNDARIDFPYAAYDELRLDTVETEESGDVYARFRVRVKEVYASIKLIEQALEALPEGPICTKDAGIFKKNAVAISVVEGWRGEILYFLKTDAFGKIERVAPRDPSFVNWSLLEYAGAHNVVPDFPLINKSFNLSYTGNDL